MNEAQSVSVDLQSSSGKHSHGNIQVKVLSRSERMKRAWKGAGLCLGIAIVSIFLPLLHFVLVPGFLIASPFVFSWLYSWESVILPGDVACPTCGESVHIVYNREKWPFHEVCTHCRNELTAVRNDASN
jgi:hypothetical protein